MPEPLDDATSRRGSGTRFDPQTNTASLWDRIHEANAGAIDAAAVALRSAPERAIVDAVRRHTKAGDRLVELGCGGSRLLPYFGLSGLEIAGVDFSRAGIRQTRAVLERQRLDPSGIEIGEVGEYARQHQAEFDIAVSFGLIEHFGDLEDIVSTHFACVRPGGHVFMSVPNLSGMQLTWTRWVAPSLLAWHAALVPADVVAACAIAGGVGTVVEYLGGPRLYAYPIAPNGRTAASAVLARLARKLVNGTGEALNRASPTVAASLAGAALSPYFGVTSTRGR
jgi:2-polyprenyl-3-methyl-5-hydroxy-6-metoxy-1,4-benzoquinol methylase